MSIYIVQPMFGMGTKEWKQEKIDINHKQSLHTTLKNHFKTDAVYHLNGSIFLEGYSHYAINGKRYGVYKTKEKEKN